MRDLAAMAGGAGPEARRNIVTMAGRQALVLMAGGVLAALGCAHSYPPPIELVEARAAYIRAEQGPAAQLATARMAAAKQALSSAEQSYGEAPESEVRDWSYIAIRWIQGAEVEAEAELALQRRQRALYELAGLSGPHAERARAELTAGGVKVQPPVPTAATEQPSAGQTPRPAQPITTEIEANRPPPAQAQPGQTPLEAPAPVQGTVGTFRIGPGASPTSGTPSGAPATPTTPATSSPPSAVTPPPLPTLPPPSQPVPPPARTTPPPAPSTSTPPSTPR